MTGPSGGDRQPVTLLVEPDPNGHRFQAVAHVAAVAGRNGDVLLLTSVGATETSAYAIFVAGLGFEVIERFEEIYPPTYEMVAAVVDVCRVREVETVLVMDADQTLKRWWRLAPQALRALPRERRPRVAFMITRYPTRVRPTDWTGWKMRAAKATLTMLAMATGSLHHAAGFAGRDDASRGWVIKRARDPDVCSAHSRDRLAIRDELALPRERTLVGIYGVITTGKSPALVWEALQSKGIDADLLLAGSLTPEVAAWVEAVEPTAHGRVIVREGFLPDDVLDKLVATADVVPLAMTHNGPSGIMGKALAAGVPVVTAGSKVRAKELLATNAGELADLTAESLGAAVERVLARDRDVTRRSTIAPATPEEFARTLLGVDT